MKIIKYYNQFINEEAIPYSKVKPYLEIERSESVIQILNEIFDKLKNIDGATTSKRGDRVYIPYVNSDTEISKVQLEIEDVLNEKGYKITDYKKGLCVSEKGVTIKIGKLLNRLGYKDLLNKFNTDSTREDLKNRNKESYIVFSKHPYDIAGMSTGRDWTSCMDIYKGKMRKYVKYDIKEGSIIAYLVNSDDLNINNPKSRILIKPFIKEDDGNDIIYLSEKVYGLTSNEFKKSVDDILNNIQEISISIYNLKKDLYIDTSPRFLNLKHLKGRTKEEVKQILDILKIKKFKINDDLTVDVEGNVNISNLGFHKIPINFNEVDGYFNCSNNQLTTLKGAPQSVFGDFCCSVNELTSLVGSPELVYGEFDCSGNQLTDLVGSPKTVSGDFYCSNNQLTNLVGAPESVGEDFICDMNNLLTLEGKPNKIVGYFSYSSNPVYTIDELINFKSKYIENIVINNKLDLNKLNSLLKEMGKPPVDSVKGYKNIKK